MVVAHVRRATVGGTTIENTHPFSYGKWIFAHNGTVPNFLKVRDRMLPEIDSMLANDIKGTTDSEHIFSFFFHCVCAIRKRICANWSRQALTAYAGGVPRWIRRSVSD